MRILDYISAETVMVSSLSGTKEESIRALTALLAAAGKIPDAQALEAAILRREQAVSTALGEGVAIPHAKLEGISSPSVALGLCKEGVPYDAPDGKPVRILFLIASCLKDDGTQLKILAALARYIKTPGFVNQLQSSQTPQDVLGVFSQFEAMVRL